MAEPALQFLELPSELILSCLVHLPYLDLLSCLKTGSRLLRDIIVDSVLIKYRLQQEKACVEENASETANSVISDRIDALRSREANWLNFSPRSRHTLTIDFVTSGVYDLASDIYLVGDTPDQNTGFGTAVKYICTSPGLDAPQWHRVDAGKVIIDFGTALEEHDLIAMVTYTPSNGSPEMMSVDVLLLKFSTGHPHPMAARPTLHIHEVEVEVGRPGVSIEIVGENLAISLVYWGDERRHMDTLHIYDWQTGLAKMAPLDVNNTGLVFLTMDTLIVPNSVEGALDVYYIPPSTTSALPRFLHSFYLPELAPGHILISFQARGEPNPRASRTRPSRGKFLPRPDRAVFLFSFEIGNAVGATEHMIVVDRPAFARALAACDPDASDIPWSAWGPRCTRWLDATLLSMHYITTTCGTRMVTVPHDARLKPAPVTILDFNAARVQAERRAERSDDDRIRVVEPDEMESAVARAPFAEPVVSLLPYVETRSKELFSYAAVLINDESIIGVKFDDGAVEELEVLHFG